MFFYSIDYVTSYESDFRTNTKYVKVRKKLNETKINKLIIGTITAEEIIELHNCLKNPKNHAVLESYVRDNHDLNLAIIENNVDEAYKKVIQKIDNTERPVKVRLLNWTKYAAAIVLLFGLAFFYQQGFFSLQDSQVLVPGDESITLELDNGTIQTIDINGNKEVRGSDGNILGVQNKNQLSYTIADQKELVFNTLKIPNGKKFQLELSDGTLVHLNAGSTLRYPVAFLTEGQREVVLFGEAYFDVSKNEENPFIVHVGELDVKVLGTEFNISAYDEDENIDVILVEGAVNLLDQDDVQSQAISLSPGEKGSLEHRSRNINVEQVNTSLYTSWMQGNLVFREETFNSILKKLERHYNIEITNTNVELGKEVFNASFDNVDIEEVFGFFNDIHSIDFKIEGNKVLIK